MISHDQHTCDHHHHSHHHHHHLVEAEVIPVSNLTIQDLHLCILIIWWRRTLELWWEEIGNMMRRHGKYIWTPNSETSPHHQSFPFVFIIIVSIIIVGIIVGIIIDDIIIVIDRPHHYNWTGQIPDPLKARSCAGWGRGWLLLIEEQTWANIVLPLLYIFLQLKNFLCRHDHVHWHLIIAIVVIEMMITIEQTPAPRAAWSAGSSRFQSLPRLPPRDGVDDQASVGAADGHHRVQGDDDGVVQLLQDGRRPLQTRGDVGVVDLVKRRHLQSHLLLLQTDWLVDQVHIARPRVVGVSL